ncbi:MAG: beta-phosphoglucomutase [Paenisporosarcina sp.]
MNKNLKAVIFDLDGVITDTAEYHFQAWQALGEEIGVPFTREFNEELKGVSRMDSLEKILALGNKLNDFTQEEKKTMAARKNKHYVRLIEGITPSDILPGIKDLIYTIKTNGLKLGLASVSKNAFSVMDKLELTDQFDVIVDAAKIQKGKPNPEIFLKAAEMLGVEASECLGIEDAAAGVESIKGAGMFAVGIGNEETLKKADLIYNSTLEVSFEELTSAYTNSK